MSSVILTTDAKATILAEQQKLLAQINETLKDYPDKFYIAVHSSNQVIFSGTTGDSERLSVWLIEVMKNNVAFLEYFRDCVKQVDELKAKG